MKYKGYFIQECGDGTFDILDGGDLVDGEFKSKAQAQAYIVKLIISLCDHDWEDIGEGLKQCTYPECQIVQSQ
jgi:hypothetical protein